MSGGRGRSGLWIAFLSIVLFGVLFFYIGKMTASFSASNRIQDASGSTAYRAENSEAAAAEEGQPLEESSADGALSLEEDSEAGEEFREDSLETELERNDLWILFDNLKFGRQEKQPRIAYYAVILIIYIILLGPVSYFVLKRFDKMEWMWGYIPALSLVFSFWIIGSSSDTRLREPDVDALTVLSPQQDNVVYVASTSPGRKSYELFFDARVKGVLPLYMGGEYALYGDSLIKRARTYTILQKGTGTTLCLNPQSAFTKDYFRLNLEKQEEQGIEISMDTFGGLPVGEVVNSTQYDFACMILYYEDQYSLFQKVGSSKTVHIAKKDWKSVYSPGAMGISDRRGSENGTDQLLTFAYEKYFLEAYDGRVYLAGILPDYQGILDGEEKSLVSKAIYYQWYDIGEDGAQEDADGTGDEEEAKETGSNENRQDGKKKKILSDKVEKPEEELTGGEEKRTKEQTPIEGDAAGKE